MASGPSTHGKIDGETVKTVTDLWGSKITADGDCSHEVKRLFPWKKKYDQPRQHIKKQRYYFADKTPESYGFSSSVQFSRSVMSNSLSPHGLQR